MSTSESGEFTLPAVYLVVTVTVDRRKVAVSVIAMVSIPMMELDQGIRGEEESTGWASPPLLLNSAAMRRGTPG